MRAKRAILLLALVGAAAPAGAASMWDVFEGPNRSTKGSWALNDQLEGNARMSLPSGKLLTYSVHGMKLGNDYAFQRSNAGDLVACSYHGEVALGSGKIVGTRICGAERTPWVAIPR